MSGPAKILAVDDEADFEQLIRQRFRRHIRDRELVFRFARHGEEALAVLAEEPGIELLLLDINMPVVDGLTCSRFCGSDSRRSERSLSRPMATWPISAPR